MKESFQHDGIRLDLYRSQGSDTTVYILLPRGLGDETEQWAEEVSSGNGTCRSEAGSISIVLVRGMDWNNDLTPWPAPGVFRKAKPFEGRAKAFLKALTDEQVPWFESQAGLACSSRVLVGISLSGLFALWAGHMCGSFDTIAAISGSFWYDSLTEWVASHSIDPAVKKFYIALGDREKTSKDPRMCKVEACTECIVSRLSEQTKVEYVLEKNVTHFSPIVPRLERLLLSLRTNRE